MKKYFAYDPKTLSARMQQCRVYEKDWTYNDLSNVVGISASALRKIEIAAYENIKVNTLINLARSFDCHPLWLIGLIDERKSFTEI